MKNKINISAVIPTFNREKTIARAVDSVLAQTYQSTEVIVMDDGSIDKTKTIVEKYNSKVRYLFQHNQGVASARNTGVRGARFEWIAFLDSDDYWLPDHLERFIEAIQHTKSKADLYFRDIKRCQAVNRCLHWDISEFRIKEDIDFRNNGSEWALMANQPMMLQASLIRKKAYLRIGGIPECLKMREDTYFFLKIGLTSPVCAVSGVGTIMGSEDEHRLTQVYSSQNSLVYWNASVILYKKILTDTHTLTKGQRRKIIKAFSSSYFSIARIYFREKRFLFSVKFLFLAFNKNKKGFCSETIESTKRYLCKWKNEIKIILMSLTQL